MATTSMQFGQSAINVVLNEGQLPAKLSTDASGNTVLVGADGVIDAPFQLASFTPTNRALLEAQAPAFNWGGTISASDWSISSGSPTVTTEIRNGRPCLKIVTGAGTTANIDLNIADAAWFGRAFCQVEASRATGTNQLITLITNDNFTNYAQGVETCLTNPTNNPTEPGGVWTFNQGDGGTAFTMNGGTWSVTPPATDGTVVINKIRFRIIPVAATVATVYLYGVTLAPRRKKSRIFVTADDGYKSFINIGLPILQARGIPVTMSVIGNLIGTAGYLSWADCRQIVASGGQVCPHGPVVGSAAGNLIINHSTTEARIADMLAAVDYIRDNGAASPNFDKVYVWPQGQHQSSTGDTALLDAAHAAGFVVGRSATPITSRTADFSTLSKNQMLALPIIGHSYAGAGEAANISAISTEITQSTAVGADVVLMLHKTVKDADTPDALGIRTSDLITLANLIKSEVDAGRATVGVLGDLVPAYSEWAR